jgi:hypothetical protein
VPPEWLVPCARVTYPFLIAVLFWLVSALTAPVHSACPQGPPDLVPPPAMRQQVDLIAELAAPRQAGGEIAVYCAPDGTPRAGRRARPPRDVGEERARRAEHWALAGKLNLAGKGEAHPSGLPLAPTQLALLERFAMSDAGAVWLREVADDTLRLFNNGYLEIDGGVWARAVRSGSMPRLTELITGRLTDEGLLADDAALFLFSGYAGAGAMSQPGAIGLGEDGMRCFFPLSEEPVDPIAILSHEFGHTRYGDPASAGTLVGEARTVELYENPVRERNGFPPRTVYFERFDQGPLQAREGGLIERLLQLDRHRGIAIGALTRVDRYHCDCRVRCPSSSSAWFAKSRQRKARSARPTHRTAP